MGVTTKTEKVKTIQSLFLLPAVTGFIGKDTAVKSIPQPDRLVGIELEIENFRWETGNVEGFNFTNDGSLRNSGIEAVSLPVSIKFCEKLLQEFFEEYPTKDSNYSERCSVHVHFNVLDLTTEQLAAICLVYQTVERLLFTFVAENRSKNIFCVPWYQSGLTYNYVSELTASPGKVKTWQKYTALNLLPVSEQGTIEFRHLEGTGDYKRILNWIYILANIFDYCLSRSFDTVKDEIMNMNTVSNYREWLQTMFGNYSELLTANNQFEPMLAKGVVDSKYMLLKKPDENKLSYPHVQFEAWNSGGINPTAFIVDDEGPRNIPTPPRPPRRAAIRPTRQNAQPTVPEDSWMLWPDRHSTLVGRRAVNRLDSRTLFSSKDGVTRRKVYFQGVTEQHYEFPLEGMMVARGESIAAVIQRGVLDGHIMVVREQEEQF